jgi:hypothetical protein
MQPCRPVACLAGIFGYYNYGVAKDSKVARWLAERCLQPEPGRVPAASAAVVGATPARRPRQSTRPPAPHPAASRAAGHPGDDAGRAEAPGVPRVSGVMCRGCARPPNLRPEGGPGVGVLSSGPSTRPPRLAATRTASIPCFWCAATIRRASALTAWTPTAPPTARARPPQRSTRPPPPTTACQQRAAAPPRHTASRTSSNVQASPGVAGHPLPCSDGTLPPPDPLAAVARGPVRRRPLPRMRCTAAQPWALPPGLQARLRTWRPCAGTMPRSTAWRPATPSTTTWPSPTRAGPPTALPCP